MKDPMAKATLNSISRQLEDMLSTPFGSHIISYEPPKGFLVPKFTMYNEMSDYYSKSTL